MEEHNPQNLSLTVIVIVIDYLRSRNLSLKLTCRYVGRKYGTVYMLKRVILPKRNVRM